ncbi:TetR/AcrR family transcriptional regulator C-terminal domain-containing protein [Dysosmobacter sp.]
MSLTTKRALAASFKKLLAQRGIDKITVKDIVEECGVNRQTFYYHFHDIYDLMAWSFQDAAQELAGSGLENEDWTTALWTLMDYLRKERVLVLNAYHSVSHEILVDYIKKLLRPYIFRVVERQAGGAESHAKKERLDFVTDIFTLTATGLVTDWIGHKMETPNTEERLRKFQAAMNGSVQFALHNLAEYEQTREGE